MQHLVRPAPAPAAAPNTPAEGEGLSLPHRLWRLLPRQSRRAALRRLAVLLAPRPDASPPPPSPGLAVAGELSRASGLGEGARLMLRALGRLGVPASEVAPRTPLPPAARPLVLHLNSPDLPRALLALPRPLLRQRLVIGYWAWELPTLPPAWRAGLPYIHRLWVPSAFVADALRTLYAGPIDVVPHPVGSDPAALAPLGRSDFNFPPGVVVVLTAFSLASSFVRKNPLAAIAAFRAAFADRPDRLLVLKISHASHFPDDLRRLRAAAAGRANIRLDTTLHPPETMRAMTAAADIVLSLHRSEGFGLVPAEAMRLGRPVIATGWSGNMDFMDAASAALVHYRLIPAQDPRGVFEAPGAVWAEPDLDDAVHHLRHLAADASARARLGAAGARKIEATLTDAPLARALAALGAP